MAFTVRTTAPKAGNRYYNTVSNGGYSNCILGNVPYGAAPTKRTGLKGLNTLPNCVGYVCGAFNEQGGYNKMKYNFNTDAKNFITLATKMGLKTGKTPQVGAIIVWTDSSCGHVAIVTEVISPTEIKVMQSGWSYKGASGVWSAIHKKGTDGNWIQGEDYSWMNGRHKFLGFVYHPDYVPPLIPKDIKVSFLSTLCTVTVIEKDGYNYIRLRDLEEKLHLCAIGYFNNKVTINGQYVDLTKFNIIKLEDTNYIKATDLQDKLKNCTVSYDTAKKLVVIKPK